MQIQYAIIYSRETAIDYITSHLDKLEKDGINIKGYLEIVEVYKQV